MDSELRYVQVPRRPLEEMRRQRALSLARQFLQRAGRTMALQAQQLDAPAAAEEDRRNELAEEFLRNWRTRHWD